MLTAMGVLTVADTQALGLLCDALGEYVDLRAVVQLEGRSFEGRGRPEVKMAADAWRRAAQMLADFGLNPVARAKVHAQVAPAADPFEELLGGSRSAG